jgi:hypothetical protein
VDRKLLAIYLNDHLAGATAGRELARRVAGDTRDGAPGRFLTALAREVDEDRETLRSLMRGLGVREDHVKVLAGWSAEKAGRLKLNGRLWSYSPLSLVVELEGLSLGVAGKLALWRSLERLSEAEPRISELVDLPALIRRANRQRRGLERHRLEAVERGVGQPA